MERHIERLLNRISLVVAGVATLSLFHLFFHASRSCFPISSTATTHCTILDSLTLSLTPFPRSSCSLASRPPAVPPERRLAKIRSSLAWRHRSASFSSLFAHLRHLALLRNSSRVLCVSAGPGHEVAVLRDSGVSDVTGVDLVDSPPLVSRADPHNLPFFDAVFDLGFSTGLPTALFPSKFASEIERTVRPGGAVVVTFENLEAGKHVEEIGSLFPQSSILEVSSITLDGVDVALIIMRVNEISL